MLIFRVLGHEDLVAELAFEGGYGDMTAHMVLHVAERSEFFRAHPTLENLVEAA